MPGKLILNVPGGAAVALTHCEARIRVQRHPRHHERLIIHAPAGVTVQGVPVRGVAVANVFRERELRPVTIAHGGEEIRLCRGQGGADKLAFEGPMSFVVTNKAG